jgi:mRNA-degrading endonuclease toxin of MazEF toxin-antitoxin module
MPKGVLQQGSIVFVSNLPDERGENLKTRRVVVVTPTEEIGNGELISVVAITSRIDLVPPDKRVKLRSRQPNGHPSTSLNKESVAACHWQDSIPEAELQDIRGKCNTFELEQILERIFS